MESALLIRKDYDPLLGFSLSLFEGRLVTRCYAGKAFNMKKLLKKNLELLKLRSHKDDPLAVGYVLSVAVEDLVEGLSVLLGDHQDPATPNIAENARAHEYFYNAGVTARNLASQYESADVKKEGLRTFDRLLLCYKIQAICGYFQFLEQKYGVERVYPSDEFVGPSLVKLVDQLMETKPVRDATRTLVTKGWTIQRKKKKKNAKKKKKSSNHFTVGKKIKAIPGSASYVMLRSLLLDRAIQTYTQGSLMPSRYSSIWNTEDSPSMFQQKLKVQDKDARTVLWTEEANSNLITLAFDDNEDVPKQKTKVELMSSITFATKGTIPLRQEVSSVYASNTNWFIVGFFSGVIEVYDSNSFEMITTLDNGCHVTCLVIDSFSKRLFSGGVDGSIKEWDPFIEYEVQLSFKAREAVQVKAFSYNELSVLTGNTSTVTCLVTDERALLEQRAVRYLVSGYSNGKVDVWNLLSGNGCVSHMFSIFHDDSGSSCVTALAITSSSLFSGGADGLLRVWDLFSDRPQKECLKTILLTETVSSIAVDDDVIFTSSGKHLRSYDRTTFLKVHELELPDTINALCIDKNRYLYTFEQSIRKWNIEALVETLKLEKQQDTMLVRRSRSSPSQYPRESIREMPNRLKRLLQDPKKRNQFMGFLRTVYADENLNFWISVQRYREFFTQGTTPDDVGQVGLDIVKKYIDYEAEHCLNISQEMREPLINLRLDEFKKNTFDAVEKEILRLMDGNFVLTFTENERYFSSTYEKGKTMDRKRNKGDPRLLSLML